jgi:8-hydroxy-5-deazaflavin:NADPH oxidoreductase
MTTIAILGGTGRQGLGLALRWARAGHEILIGSRRPQRAVAAATALRAPPHEALRVRGLDNLAAAEACAVAVLSVPYSSQRAVLEAVRMALVGKVLISVVVPLKPPDLTRAWRPPAGSAAQEAQELVGDSTPVVAAFQNVSAIHLAADDHRIEGDVLVCGDDDAAKAMAIALAADAGLRGFDAGPLINAGVVEGLTAVLIGINVRYRARGAGIRLTGV